ncbi:MAG: hypothetical protein EXR76_13875 [Myxococcales bacterium]|nr:hypothetical protein [Myxococcales bacterium]
MRTTDLMKYVISLIGAGSLCCEETQCRATPLHPLDREPLKEAKLNIEHNATDGGHGLSGLH